MKAIIWLSQRPGGFHTAKYGPGFRTFQVKTSTFNCVCKQTGNQQSSFKHRYTVLHPAGFCTGCSFRTFEASKANINNNTYITPRVQNGSYILSCHHYNNPIRWGGSIIIPILHWGGGQSWERGWLASGHLVCLWQIRTRNFLIGCCPLLHKKLLPQFPRLCLLTLDQAGFTSKYMELHSNSSQDFCM